jgi:hypothetical protein
MGLNSLKSSSVGGVHTHIANLWENPLLNEDQTLSEIFSKTAKTVEEGS